MAALANAASQEFLVEEAVKAVAPPRGVKLSRIYFDTDHAGDRALRIVFSVSKRVPLTSVRVGNLAAYMDEVQDAALGLQLGAFPYVSLEDVA